MCGVVCVKEAGLQLRICAPWLSLQPETNHPAFCLEQWPTPSNCTARGTQMEPQKSLYVSACVWMHVCLFAVLNETASHKSRTHKHTPLSWFSDAHRETIWILTLNTSLPRVLSPVSCLGLALRINLAASRGTAVKTRWHAMQFLRRPFLGGPHPGNYGLFPTHKQPSWL